MTSTEITNIINVVAIIVIPIVAVVIGRILQDRSEKRKDKVNVFTHLMSYRKFGYVSQPSVNILNSVPIVFHDDDKVIENFNNYIVLPKVNLDFFEKANKVV